MREIVKRETIGASIVLASGQSSASAASLVQRVNDSCDCAYTAEGKVSAFVRFIVPDAVRHDRLGVILVRCELRCARRLQTAC